MIMMMSDEYFWCPVDAFILFEQIILLYYTNQ